MSGTANAVFRPDFTDYTTPQNRLAPQPTWADAATYNAQAVGDYIAQQRAKSEQMGLWDPNTGLPTGPGVVNAAQQYGSGLLMGTTAPGIRAFHGSPYDFERFDTSKIGTGEGAQAYGHGLYFADKPGTAETYKFANQPSYMNAATANVAQDAYQQAVKSGVNDPLAAARNSLWERRQASTDPIERRRIDDAYNNIEQLTQPGGAGHTYEVNIGADPEQFLHWDKPYAEQSPNVQQALQNVYDNKVFTAPDAVTKLDSGRFALTQDGNVVGRTDGWPDQSTAQYVLKMLQDEAKTNSKLTGGNLLSSGGRGLTPEGTAQQLRDAGIPGIRYLDQGSRGTAFGEHMGTEQTPDGWHAKIRVDNRGGGAGGFQAPTLIHTTSPPFPTKEAADAWAQDKIGNATHNYVVFDANTIDILRKYGLAGLGIGLGGAAAGTQQQSQ